MKKLISLIVITVTILSLSCTMIASSYNSSSFSGHTETCRFSVTSSGDVFEGTLGAETCRGSKSVGANVRHFNKRITSSCSISQSNLTATYGFHAIHVTTGLNGSVSTYGYDY